MVRHRISTREPCRKWTNRSFGLPASFNTDADGSTQNLLELLEHGGTTSVVMNGHTPSKGKDGTLQEDQTGVSKDHTYSNISNSTGNQGDNYYSKNVTPASPDKTRELTVFASELDWNMWKFEQKLFETVRKFPFYYLTNDCIRTLGMHHFNVPYSDIQLPDDFYPTDGWISQYRKKYGCVTSPELASGVLDKIRVDLKVPVFTPREMTTYLREGRSVEESRVGEGTASDESLFKKVLVTKSPKKGKKRKGTEVRGKPKPRTNGCQTTFSHDLSPMSRPVKISTDKSSRMPSNTNGCSGSSDEPTQMSQPEVEEVTEMNTQQFNPFTFYVFHPNFMRELMVFVEYLLNNPDEYAVIFTW